MMTYIGIDPGKKGAIAFITEQGETVHDMPLDWDGRIDAQGLLILITSKVVSANSSICFLEKSQAMPGQGVTSTFNYGAGYGAIRAVLQIACVPFQEIHPMKWKKEYALIKKEKADSVAIARQLFPNAPLVREKRGGVEMLLDGRAEAILIAEFCRRQTR
jgi:crossover junction endodeoxyribonuclease RuvC